MSLDKIEDVKELYKIIAQISDENVLADFFDDLCTYKEIEAMAGRVKAAKLLMQGETYEKIISQTDISSATLSRVSKCVKRGKGYNAVLKKD